MLHDDLKKLDCYPFHMPGHKRNSDFDIIGSQIDITEIYGSDNLHSPTGSILEIENSLSDIYKSKRSFMLVNGSTVGILAAIFALTEHGDKIIIAANCHKSVYNACMLRGLQVSYIEPEFDEELGCYTKVTQKAVNTAIENNPNAACVVITNPTYEGCVSSIKSSIPLIVDAAHGAHFCLDGFPEYPKGDVVVSSLHKTLPALTQTAVLNVFNSKYTDRIKFYLAVFESSSPSYVLMNSVSKCVEFLKKPDEALAEYNKNLDEFYRIDLKNLKIKRFDDSGKIIVSTAFCNIDGTELSVILREKHKIECEAASINYIILMTSVADKKSAFDLLTFSLKEIDAELKTCQAEKVQKPYIHHNSVKIDEIKLKSPSLLSSSIGKVCAEFVYSYPPDIPILIPGDIITYETVNTLKNMYERKINLLSDSDLLPRYILTKDS